MMGGVERIENREVSKEKIGIKINYIATPACGNMQLTTNLEIATHDFFLFTKRLKNFLPE